MNSFYLNTAQSNHPSVNCCNDPHDERAILCQCVTFGGGLHVWGVDGTNCSHLQFSPGQTGNKSCNRADVVIKGYLITTDSDSFISELKMMPLLDNFRGAVNCTFRSSGNGPVIVGEATIAGTCIIHICITSKH